MGPRLSAALALRPKHFDRPGYFVARWLRRRRRLLHDRGPAPPPARPARDRRVEVGELADHAEANRARGDLDRRLVLRHPLPLPDPPPPLPSPPPSPPP